MKQGKLLQPEEGYGSSTDAQRLFKSSLNRNERVAAQA